MTGNKGTNGSSEGRTPPEWLAAAAPDPAACLREWERDPSGLALLPAGRLWDVLVLAGELGRTTLRVLSDLLDRPGPVLAGFGDDRIGYLVPAGTAAHWVGSGVRGAGPGTWIVVPMPGRTAGGVRWLVPPDGSGTLTDPVLLELAMHEAAARLADAAADDGAEQDGAPRAATSWSEAGDVERGGQNDHA